MIIRQLSVFLENKSGRLTEVLTTLGAASINIKAITVADTSEYGILRLVVSQPEVALKILKEKGFSTNLTDVISIATSSEPGAFSQVFDVMSKAGIGIEYTYGFSIGNKGALILRPEDIHKAIEVLQSNNQLLLKPEEFDNF